MKTLAAVAFAVAGHASAASVATQNQLNPIRKVVNMLQAMQKKVQDEGEKEKDLYEKFMCHCKNGKGDLAASIQAAEEKGPAVTSHIAESEAKLAQSKDDLKKAQEDRSAAKAAIKAATALREKEAEVYAGVKADADAN